MTIGEWINKLNNADECQILVKANMPTSNLHYDGGNRRMYGNMVATYPEIGMRTVTICDENGIPTKREYFDGWA